MKLKNLLFAFVASASISHAQQINVVFYDDVNGYRDRQNNVVSDPTTPGSLIVPKETYYGLSSGKTPVLVVHGFTNDGQIMQQNWMGALNQGQVKSAYITTDPIGDVTVNGAVVKKAIDTLTAMYGVPQISIIAHSRGGVDVEMALYKLGAARKVAGVYTFGSPHNGSIVADAASNYLISLVASAVIGQGLSTNITSSFNTAALSYYWSNASSYTTQKKVSASSFVTVNPKTDTYTRWWTGYGNDPYKTGFFGFTIINNYIWSVANTQACGVWVIFGCRGDGANDGLIENRSSKRNMVSGVGRSYLVTNNGDHFSVRNGSLTTGQGNEVIPFLPFSSSLYKSAPQQPEKKFDDDVLEIEKNAFLTSLSKTIGSVEGQAQFVVEEDNKEVYLNLFTSLKPMDVEIKNTITGERISTQGMKTIEDKDHVNMLNVTLFMTELNFTGLKKGKYSIHLKQPFFGYSGSKEYSIQTGLDLGFKNSEGFNFKNSQPMTLHFSDASALNLESIKTKAHVRKIATLDGQAIENSTGLEFAFQQNKEEKTFDGKIPTNLEEGFYSITVTTEGGDDHFIDRTFTTTFFVNKENAATGLNEHHKDTDLKIYPNPIERSVSILLKNEVNAYTVTIYSITGALIKTFENSAFSGKLIELDLSTMDNGFYLIKVKADDVDYTTKITIQK